MKYNVPVIFFFFLENIYVFHNYGVLWPWTRNWWLGKNKKFPRARRLGAL